MFMLGTLPPVWGYVALTLFLGAYMSAGVDYLEHIRDTRDN